MKRKQFKRNIQASRQRRSVTYMSEQSFKRRENLKNAAGGFCIGIFLILVLFVGYGVFK